MLFVCPGRKILCLDFIRVFLLLSSVSVSVWTMRSKDRLLCNSWWALRWKKINCSHSILVSVNGLGGMKPPYEDAYQHMWAQCRSTGPGHWARPHTWWRWIRVACNLDCTQTAPPCRCQSRSLSASRSVALGLSCTEWRLSWGQLWWENEKEQERREDANKAGWWVCVVETQQRREDGEKREVEKW